jgi:hypothetical protein
MTLIEVISTENAILCGSIMPIIAPILFCNSLIYMVFIRLVNDTFVARRHLVSVDRLNDRVVPVIAMAQNLIPPA